MTPSAHDERIISIEEEIVRLREHSYTLANTLAHGVGRADFDALAGTVQDVRADLAGFKGRITGIAWAFALVIPALSALFTRLVGSLP